MQSSSSGTTLNSQSSTQLDVSDSTALVILENILNVRLTGNPSGAEGSQPVLLENVRDLLASWTEAEVPVNFDDVIASSFLEITSKHIDGSLRQRANPVQQRHDRDVSSLLTEWILESIERSYVEERNNPKVCELVNLIDFSIY